MWLIFSLLNAFFESLAQFFGKKGVTELDVYTVGWAMPSFSKVGFFIHSLEVFIINS